MAALNFLTITNFVESVIEDVGRIRRAPVSIYRYYDYMAVSMM
ncbi:MAG: hypothetical protein JWR67_2184 [Mucilaginibacter sp.]|nr:hypothetical protein [Mucilaginibacter sp.]